VTLLAAPAAPPQPRLRRLAGPLSTIGVLSAATLALHLRDPHQQGSWGFCPFHALTGLWCPGCGGLRAVNDLTDGHLRAALSSNIVVTLAIPLAVVALLLWVRRAWTGKESQPDWQRAQRWTYALVALLVAFTVVRNLAFGAWLAP
jgi:hypothetical protein